MRSFLVCLAASLAFAGASHAQAPEVLRGSSSASTAQKKSGPAKPAVHKPTPAAHTHAVSATKRPVTPQNLRGSRYGGFAPAPAQPEAPPPTLDLTSPRTLSLLNVTSQEMLTVTYWSDGAYRRDALDKLNHFL